MALEERLAPRLSLPQLGPVTTESRLKALLHSDVAGGIVLLVAAAIALAWANSPWAATYEALWHAGIPVAGFRLDLHFLINDGLMTLFFFVVGLEVRRELHDGTLADRRQAALPLIAALGGVLLPALIYLNWSQDPAALPGWAVPTATDIAFAVGVLALLGNRVPPGLRILLLAIAIIDDIAAILIIAFVYSDGVGLAGLGVSVAGILAILALQRLGVWRPLVYVLPGAVIWLGLLQAGIHPVVDGVIVGLLTPTTPNPAAGADGEPRAPVVWLQERLHGWSTFLVMPLFALANAGVRIAGNPLGADLPGDIFTGVVLGLVLGKPLGILAASWLAARLGLITLPAGVTWPGFAVIGCLAGIGFTMSIFIGNLAFDDGALLDAVKLGVLAGSAVAALSGLTLGVFLLRRGDRA
jgi:NhaA family Na+:H+ antiporter